MKGKRETLAGLLQAFRGGDFSSLFPLLDYLAESADSRFSAFRRAVGLFFHKSSRANWDAFRVNSYWEELWASLEAEWWPELFGADYVLAAEEHFQKARSVSPPSPSSETQLSPYPHPLQSGSGTFLPWTPPGQEIQWPDHGDPAAGMESIAGSLVQPDWRYHRDDSER